MPNFWRTVSHRRIFLKKFPLSMLIFGQKSCFLGSTIFEIPQLNWHYSLIVVYLQINQQKLNTPSKLHLSKGQMKSEWIYFPSTMHSRTEGQGFRNRGWTNRCRFTTQLARRGVRATSGHKARAVGQAGALQIPLQISNRTDAKPSLLKGLGLLLAPLDFQTFLRFCQLPIY